MSDRSVKPSAPRVSLRGGLIAAAVVASAALGYGVALLGWGPIGNSDQRLIELLQEQRQALDASISGQARAVEAASTARAQLRSDRDRREGELLVEYATRQTLERSVQEKDAELSGLREQLAFYEQLLPSGPPGTVNIRGFDLSASSDFLRYRVLLMRSGRPTGDSFKGSLQFVAEGMQDGEVRTLTLEPLVASAAQTAVDTPEERQNPSGNQPPVVSQAPQGQSKPGGPGVAEPQAQSEPKGQPQPPSGQGLSTQGDLTRSNAEAGNTLAVEFEQYQRSQCLLAVPSGFQVRTVTLNVLEGSVVRASRQIKPSR